MAIGTLLTLALALLPCLGQAAALNTSTKRYVEQYPWQIRDLTIFTAKATSAGASYISFTFNDNNTGIALQTTCQRFILPNSGQSLADSNYHLCQNTSVEFQLTNDQLKLARGYVDPS